VALAVACVGQNAVNVLLGDGTGAFASRRIYAAHAYSLAAGDLDGDGAPDLAVTTQQNNNSVFVLLNRCRR
jgi:hypothetical protein